MTSNWYASGTSGNQALVIEEGTGRSVAVAYDTADSALIAAAPEMLEVLRDWLRLVPTHGRPASDPDWHIIESARAILARIERSN